ncbi:hypothetical protein ACVWYQ_003725 [Bradyrhizobium sp. USDA 3397]
MVIDPCLRGEKHSRCTSRQATGSYGPATFPGGLSPNTAGSQRLAAGKGLRSVATFFVATSIWPNSLSPDSIERKGQISFGRDFGLLWLKLAANALAAIRPSAGALPLPTEAGAMCNSVAPSETDLSPAAKSGRASFVRRVLATARNGRILRSTSAVPPAGVCAACIFKTHAFAKSCWPLVVRQSSPVRWRGDCLTFRQAFLVQYYC